MYDFALDRDHGLLKIRPKGFWDMDTVRAFARDHQAAVEALGCGKGQHLVLVDLSDFVIQSQEVVQMCRALIERAPNASRRLALVRGEGLARIQSRRVVCRDTMRIFDSASDAECWLLSPEAPADAAPTAPLLRVPA